MIPAITITSRLREPRVGLMVEKLSAERANGRAPELIWFAKVWTSSAVKLPSITASPLVMASLTVAVLMFSSSSQMLMVPFSAASRVVASANASAPSKLKCSSTMKLPELSRIGEADSTSSPVRIRSPLAVLPSRNSSSAVVPISSIACCGSKEVSSLRQGKRTMMRSRLVST